MGHLYFANLVRNHRVFAFRGLLFVVLITATLFAVAQPVITTVSPSAGHPGTAVTITGTGFNAAPAANIVYFGATRATVSAASSTSLTVTVPSGATYMPVSVNDTATKLMGHSQYPFLPTFNNSGYVSGIVNFSPKVDFATGTTPYRLAIADIDGDGKSDIIVANGASATISIFRNTSASGTITTGSFAAKVDFATGTTPHTIKVSDLDGDGKPDIVVTHQSSNTVAIFRNTATVGTISTGSLATRVDLATGTLPTGVDVADIDGDGKPEILVANYSSNSFSVYRNIATSGSLTSGSFASRVDFSTNTQPHFIGAADLDGDGKNDIALGFNALSIISVYRNTATTGVINSGSFASGVNFTSGSVSGHLAIGDLDGDNKPEIVSANFSSNTISIFLNTATSGSLTSGSFAAKVDFTTGANPESVEIGDLDGDGKADLVVANNGATTGSYFRNISSGGTINSSSFTTKIDVTTGTSPYAIAVGDLDGDGKPDFVATNAGAATISILRNNPLIAPPTITNFTPANAHPGTSVTVTGANFNTAPAANIVYFGATRATVSAASSTSLTVSVPSGATYMPVSVNDTATKLMGYSKHPFIPTYNNSSYIPNTVNLSSKVDFAGASGGYGIAVGDIDGDGKADAVVCNVTSSSVSVYRNVSTSGVISSSSFSTKVDFTVGSGPDGVALADIDRDGKLDLIVSNYTSNTVSVLRNIATVGTITTGSFAAKADFATGAGAETVVVDDIDLDGKPDIIVGNYSAASVSVLKNTATIGVINSGSLASKVDFTVGTNPERIATGDIDGDGKPEIVVANSNSNNISILRNTTSFGTINSGAFAAKVDFSTGTRPIGVAIGDVDSDGKADICVTNNGSSTFSIFKNAATSGSITSGSLGTRVDISTSANPVIIKMSDMDGDGKADFIVTESPLSVSVYRNIATAGSISTGSVAAKFTFGLGDTPNELAIADMDGDGKPDVLSCNSSTNGMAVLRSNPFLLPPTITTVSPTNAHPGASVTVTGTNFSTAPAANIVYFGATRATVSAASSTSLTVTVPSGATHMPVSVNDSATKLIAYSQYPFLPTFNNSGYIPGTVNFSPKVDFATGAATFCTAVGDIDGDGKPDLVVVDHNDNTVSVFRNTSTSGVINSSSFATRVTFATGTLPNIAILEDFDGDGKLDIAVVNYGAASVSVLRNTSSPGSITTGSFAAKVDFGTGSAPFVVAARDLDGDGKPEMVVTSQFSNTVTVYRNISTTGSITTGSFTGVDFATGDDPIGLAISDFDGDGKPDLVVGNANDNNVSVLRNTSTSGNISTGSFASRVNFTVGSLPYFITVADIDGDGKPEIIVPNNGSGANSVSILRNTATSGTITTGSFATKFDFTVGSSPQGVTLCDMDGDGKLDMCVTNASSNTISLFRNTATAGTIGTGSFAAKVDMATGSLPRGISAGDIDGDGKPEIIVSNYSANTFSVFRNNPFLLPPTITTVTPTNAHPGASVTVTGTNFNTAPAANIVCFGATRATVSAASSTSLTVTVPSGATYQPVSVNDTATRLAGYSQYPFLPTYNNSGFIPGTVNFSPKVDFATGSVPIGAAVCDLDGDGKSDIVVTNQSSNTISIYRNTGSVGSISSGSFATKVDFSTGAVPNGVATGDIDGDGRPEIVVSNTSGASISVFRNVSSAGSIGTGSFDAKVDFTSGIEPNYVSIADIDGDGKLDIAVTYSTSNTVSVFRNTATPGAISSSSLAAKVDIATGARPTGLALADFDGDGKADIATSNYNGNNISVFRNVSAVGSITSGSFSSGVVFTAGTQPTFLATGDFDGDGKQDITVSNYGANSVSVFRNTATSGTISSGSFATKVDFSAASNANFVATGDIDGDGKVDIAFTNYVSSSISVIRNTAVSGTISTSSFAARTDFTTGPNPYFISIADLDGDGKPEIATPNSGVGTLSILRNNPFLLPPTITTVTPTNAHPGASVTVTGTNFNTAPAANIVYFGATRATVSAASSTSLTVTVPSGATYMPVSVNDTVTKLMGYSQYPFLPTYNNSGYISGTVNFSPKVDFTAGSGSGWVSLADLDGDGKTDIACANGNTNTISVYRNISTSGALTSSSFATRVDFTVGSNPGMPTIGDIDGDGKLDIAVTNTGSGTISVLRNTSTSGAITTGSFAAKVDFSAGTTPWETAIADITGDGKPELIVSNYGTGSTSVSVFHNTAIAGVINTSSFAPKVDFTVGSSPTGVAVHDIDGDGKKDVLVANFTSNTLSVLRNTATIGVLNSSSFAARQDFTTASGPVDVKVGDVDGDGKVDVCVSCDITNVLSVFRNTATFGVINSSSLATKVDFTAGSIAYGMSLADVNGDGKVDVTMSNRGANTLSIFRNTATSGTIGSGTFAAKVDFVTGTDPNGIAAGDLDGDGRPDVVVANADDNKISIFRNTPLSFIAGTTTVCVNATTTLTDTAVGGTWTSGNTAVATVGSSTGVVTGVAAGTAAITYAVAGGIATHVVTVEAAPSSISGVSLIGIGSTTTMTSSVSGGTWSSSNTGIATVNSAGVVSGIAMGSAMISYSLTNICGLTTVTRLLAVSNDTLAVRAWATYYGGNIHDETPFVTTDTAGNVYITGQTTSTTGIATSGAHQTTNGGGWDAFLVKFNNTGVRLWATYYGGSGPDYGTSIGVDATGNVYLTGITAGSSSGIATSGAHQGTSGGGNDVFLVKFNNLGIRQWGTFFGRGDDEYGQSICIDASGNPHVGGITRSTSGNATSGAHQTAHGGGTWDALLTKFNASGALQWSTYYGGSGNDYQSSLAVDTGGNVYLAGYTGSASGIATSGSHQSVYGGGGNDAFIAKFNSAGVRLWGTYYGGSGDENGAAIATDQSDNIFIAGRTSSTSGIATTGAHQVAHGGGTFDGFLAKVSGTGVRQWATYYGGSGDEIVGSCALSINTYGEVFFTGYTASTAAIATSSGFQAVYGGGANDAFLVKLNSSGIRLWGTYYGASGSDMGMGVAVDIAGNAFMVGTTNSTTGIASAGSHQPVYGGGTYDGYLVRFGGIDSIVGIRSICAGFIATLSNTTAGGTWSSSNNAVATVGSSTGIVTGVAAGTAAITYTVAGGSTSTTITVNPLAVTGTISGALSVTAGGLTTLSTSVAGGTWVSGNTTVATISSAGVVTGVSAGTTLISYGVSNGCGINYTTATITVGGCASLVISTLAGDGTIGFSGDGGPATAARLYHPYGVTVDNAGNIYIADNENLVLRKINTSGVITTVAGNRSSGHSGDGGAATAATFLSVSAVVVDAAGNLYIADGGYVRKVNASGIITTIAGTGTAGYTGDGGPAVSARLRQVIGLAIDNAGNLYLPDYGSHVVRKINTSGIISTVAGTGTAGYSGNGGAAVSATLNGPVGVKVDNAGNIYICDAGNFAIRKVNTSGIITTIAGTGTSGFTGDGGNATAAQIGGAQGVTVDGAGDVYIGDNGRIRKISGGVINTIAGNGVGSGGSVGIYNGIPALSGTFHPVGICLDNSGSIYVADFINSALRKIHCGSFVAPITGGSSSVCAGAASTLSSSTTGGTWSSSNTAVATVGSASGLVTGVSGGTATISYIISGGYAVSTVSVLVLPSAGTITGTSLIGIGGTGTLSSSVSGGTWSSSATGIATVGSTGIVAGLSGGTVAISYRVSSALCANTVVKSLAVTNDTLAVRAWGTYYGGSGGENGRSVAVDRARNIYITGRAQSISAVATSGAHQSSHGGGTYDAYLVKFDSVGVRQWGTFYGGSSDDIGTAVTTDTTGNVYVCGSTMSTSGIATSGAHQTAHGSGTYDGFVVKFNSSGIRQWGTYYGGNNDVYGASLITDISRNVYFAGSTYSNSGIATSGAYQGARAGVTDAFIVKFDSVGNRQWGTYFGGSGQEEVFSIAGDVAGNLYIGGYTASTSGIATSGAFQSSHAGGIMDAFLVKFNSAGARQWGTYYGGSGNEERSGYVATDASGGIYLAGRTNSTSGIATSGGHVDTFGGGSFDAFLVKFDSSGGRKWGTYYAAEARAVATDGNNNVVLVGVTGSPTNISTNGGHQTVLGGGSADAYVAKFNNSGIRLVGTYYGGGSIDEGGSVAVDGSGNIFLTGHTQSTSGIASGTAHQATFGGVEDAFLVRFGAAVSSSVGVIAGTAALCTGSTTSLSNTTTGGTWTSSNTSVATVGSSSGVVYGVAAGSAIVSYVAGGGTATIVVTVNAAPSSITGTTSICVGTTTTLSSTPSGGSWSSSTNSVATVGSSSGVIGGVSIGTAIISYTALCGSVTTTVTINSAPSSVSVSGAGSVCTGNTTTLSTSGSGGSWSSSSASATVSSGGVVSGVSVGSTIVSYSVSNSCGSAVGTHTIAINSAPSSVSVSGAGSVCTGSTISLSTTGTGGSWSSSSASATVSSGGVIAGVSAGTTIVSYTVSNSCGSTVGTHTITINSAPSTITVSGAASVCTGSTITLSTTGSGGSWSSSSASATVSSGGVVSSVSTGTTIVSYSVSNSCGSTVGTHTISINGTPSSITVSGATSVCTGSTITLSTSGTGGTWSSSSASATVSSTGVVTGVSTGTTIVSYSVSNSCGSAVGTHTISINSAPSTITVSGATSVCTGATITLSTTGTGGSWSSSSASATVSSIGVVSGVSAGTTTISYSIASACGSVSGTHTVTVNSSPNPGAISGASSVLAGSIITLSSSGATGGTWSSSSATATVSGGLVGGVSAGTAVISYAVTNGCGTAAATKTITVNVPTLGSISGPSSLCAGASGTYSHATTGGVWASSFTSRATIGSTTGIVNGVSAGTTTISYTAGGVTVTTTLTVLPVPAVINGTSVVCVGAITTLSTTSSGGSWVSDAPSIATASTTAYGIVRGMAGGTTTISYVFGSGCASTRTFTVSTSPSAIMGASALCFTQTATLSNTATGGTWTSSNTSIASVEATTGIVRAFSTASNATITYTMPGGCRATALIPVVNLSTAISGTASVCAGQTTVFTHTASSGIWSSSNAAVATTGTGIGTVYGVSAGTATISYTVNAGCGQTRVVTVLAAPGAILGVGGLCVGQTLSLTNAVSGGAWASSASTRASVNATTGVVSGVSAGTALLSYSIGTCRATAVVNVSAMPSAISGATTICAGIATTLGSTPTGGTWSSSNLSVATTSGAVVRGVSGGTSVISYVAGAGCFRTVTVSVSDLPGTIIGASNLCLAQSITLSNATPGGRWSSSSTAAAIGSSSGIVTASGSITGSPIIRYTMPGNCSTSVTISVVNLAAIAGGAGSICEGKTTLFTNATAGGAWSSTVPSVASMGTGSGLVSGVAAGSSVISYSLNAGCARTTTVTVRVAPGITSGPASVCAGLTVTLSNPVSGGTWSSAPTSIATVGSTTGIVGGVAASSVRAIITYTMPGGCTDTMGIRVVTLSGITGVSSLCEGQTITLYNAAPGGTWSSSNTSVASVNVASGQVFGTAAGTATISYGIGSGCVVSKSVTVNSFAQITGPTEVCAGSTITLSNPMTGGTWSSYYTILATVDATTGVVTGVAGGGTVNTITYTLPGGCYDTARLTVNYQAPITGLNNVCEGATVHLSNARAGDGGTWSSSSTSNATITPSTADVWGVTTGNTTISYLLPTGCVATYAMTVNPAPAAITGAGVVCVGTTITMSNASAGGVWSCYYTTATIGSTSGIVTGISGGSVANIITYTIPTGCRDTALVMIDACARPAGSIVGEGSGSIRVVPNPNAGTFTISGQLAETDDELLTIEVTNMLGQVVYIGGALAQQGTILAQVQLGKNIANGMYLLTVKSTKEVRVFHIVVEQ